MPKRSDGPPLGGGYRYGGDEAFRAGLPPQAVDPRLKPSGTELQARQTLAKFSAYRDRVRSFGKSIPVTKGTSKRRASALHRREELEQHERNSYQEKIIRLFVMHHELRESVLDQLQHFIEFDQMHRYTVVHKGLRTVRILFGNQKAHWFVERNMLTGRVKRSITYGSREQAISYHETDCIRFIEVR